MCRLANMEFKHKRYGDKKENFNNQWGTSMLSRTEALRWSFLLLADNYFRKKLHL